MAGSRNICQATLASDQVPRAGDPAGGPGIPPHLGRNLYYLKGG